MNANQISESTYQTWTETPGRRASPKPGHFEAPFFVPFPVKLERHACQRKEIMINAIDVYDAEHLYAP